MNEQAHFADILASFVYPGMASVSLFWVHIGAARLMQTRRFYDALIMFTAIFATSTFILLSLSTGIFMILDFLQVRLAIRLGWLFVLIFAVWLSLDFVRRQRGRYKG